ncbi:MAG TPA: GAF domain-containing protein [Bryobacteraceae bacterium]|jgi:GAF domain-containing protein
MPAASPVVELNHEEFVSQEAKFNAVSPRTLDRIASLTAQVFAAPLSAITLIDSGWCQSFDDRALSSYAMLQKEAFVVLDPLGDARFQNHPLVTGGPGIRFYMAVPLVSRTGRVLGTLSVADTKVRLYVLPAQRAALKDLAAIAVFELEHGGR